MERSRIVLVIAIGFQYVCAAQAHEFWIEPDSYRPAVGAVLRIGLHIGHRFAGEPYAYNPERIEKFALFTAAEEQPVMGKAGAATAFAKVEVAGVQIIGYRSNRSQIELAVDKFESYLKEEGLEQIIQQRAQRGENNKPGREVYSRCAKSLICAGLPCDAQHDRALGYPLELIPAQNPYQLKPGSDLTVRLLYDGKPLAGATVVAVDKRDPEKAASVVSDAQGLAVFKLTEPGAWLITTIHMIRAPAGLDADWESFWASLTFELAE